MANTIRFAVPNQKAPSATNVVTDSTGYAVYDPVTTGVPNAQTTVPVTPGVAVVTGNGIDNTVSRSEQVDQLPGFPGNVGTSTVGDFANEETGIGNIRY